jgi:hypothetical protein
MDRDNNLSKTLKCHLKVRTGPAGLHFFNRNTGINILVDEINATNKYVVISTTTSIGGVN